MFSRLLCRSIACSDSVDRQCGSLRLLTGNNKTTVERLAVFALLLDRNPHQLSEQRFGEVAYLWMLLGGNGQGTPVPLDAVIAVGAFKLRHPSQFIERIDGYSQSLLQIIRRVIPPGSDVTACLSQDRFYLLWW